MSRIYLQVFEANFFGDYLPPSVLEVFHVRKQENASQRYQRCFQWTNRAAALAGLHEHFVSEGDSVHVRVITEGVGGLQGWRSGPFLRGRQPGPARCR